ncbi:hypothetical protein GCM10007382_22620 [Salinibacterium xinjiangense]|uniref:Uncharacterized protein n=1 Tax=Salinibacterium xinjiangense TaxID=386302 RepID=A0A2C8ZW40_9MICO|nr:hypothetical protein [Salinibacterium xinjiangense]GGL02163.1 hypothetical protein GCM10007382_22620 [Salinibacterium xinjiangense]SOE70190.1 hypothetical protein SAMN06296378_2163 [Salinibacterium xinjiangense]
MSSFEFISLAVWVGIVALQLAELTLTASRVPQLSAFSALRDELQDATGARLSADQLTDFRQRLVALDEREALRCVPASRGANAQLWRGVPWQLAAVALSFLPVVATLVGGPRNGEPLDGMPLDWGVALVGSLLPVISYALALAVARASVAAAGARTTLHAHQRAEIVGLIGEAARSSRQKVAGLGDRVARALQILREQQAEKPETARSSN